MLVEFCDIIVLITKDCIQILVFKLFVKYVIAILALLYYYYYKIKFVENLFCECVCVCFIWNCVYFCPQMKANWWSANNIF